MFDVGNLLVYKGTVKNYVASANVDETLFSVGDLGYFFGGITEQEL